MTLKAPPVPKGESVIDGTRRIIERIAQQVKAKELDKASGEAAASGLTYVDTSGTVWACGLRSGRWYAWDGRWTRRDAPDPGTLVRPEKRRAGCHACGKANKAERACACGAAPAPVLADHPEAEAGLRRFLEEAKHIVPERA